MGAGPCNSAPHDRHLSASDLGASKNRGPYDAASLCAGVSKFVGVLVVALARVMSSDLENCSTGTVHPLGIGVTVYDGNCKRSVLRY